VSEHPFVHATSPETLLHPLITTIAGGAGLYPFPADLISIKPSFQARAISPVRVRIAGVVDAVFRIASV
jgi:hypothetical protein